ncbi:hypothetical protein [Arenimonas sp.]|uniref:hypothetical protein n=1 Tax=Arenimonas sp. TaxID=1872635 RepID=UPI0039E435B6
MNLPLASILLLFGLSGSVLAAPRCSNDAVAQAHKLLAFHFGDDGRISISDKVKELPPVSNPANAKQKFAVLEVWGYVYKGEYRMRFLYYRMKDQCVLMGQEILEYARL